MSVFTDKRIKKTARRNWNNGLRNEGVYAEKILVFEKRVKFTENLKNPIVLHIIFYNNFWTMKFQQKLMR